MNYSEAMEYMEALGGLGSRPGLESITQLCQRLGNPQDKLKFLHIAGTNGKGSVLAYLSTILEKAGYKTGRYLSPVLFEYRERFQVNRTMISKRTLALYVTRAAEAAEAMEAEGMGHPTAFEMETAIAFLFFADKKCDFVVLETGMGGLLDATNLITTTVLSVFASISMDHMQFLGDTLAEIAMQKAGIIKPGVPVVSMRQKPEAMAVLQAEAKRLRSELLLADISETSKIKYGIQKQSFSYHGHEKLTIALAGICQIENAVLAVRVIEALREMGYSISEEALYQGLYETEWIGRFSVICKKPLFLVDGAHNEDAAARLAEALRFYFTNKRLVFIMGILRDKEYDKIIQLTCPMASQIITVTTPNNPRALPAYDLACAIRDINPNVTAVDSLEEAVEISCLMADSESVIIAFGSLSYLGALIHILDKRKR